MKITVKGSKLIEKLQAQRERALAKKKEAEVFLAEHTKHHKKDEPDVPVREEKTELKARRGILVVPDVPVREEKTPGVPFGRRAPHGHAVCVFETQVKAFTAHIDSHVRRIDAAIDVIDPTADVTLSLSKYIKGYVDGPYDTVTFPSPETSDDASSAQGVMTQGVQKLN